MKNILKLLGIIAAFFVIAMAAYALITILFLKGCSLAIHGKPKTEKELQAMAKSTAEYLDDKYPGRDFTVNVKNVVHRGSGLPENYQVKITAYDEDGLDFEIYDYKKGYEDNYIENWILKLAKEQNIATDPYNVKNIKEDEYTTGVYYAEVFDVDIHEFISVKYDSNAQIVERIDG